MNYIIPKYSGFCAGVSVAVDAAYAMVGERSYMYGDVVHNPTVVRDLEARGLRRIDRIDEIGEDCVGARVLIRAHGTSRAVMDELRARGVEIVDKTCANVKRIHRLVEAASARGLDAIVVGTPNHPEVEGIVGWISTRSVVLHSLEDAKRILPSMRFSEKGVFMVSQTTFNQAKYHEIHDYAASVIEHLEFHDTICNVTANRQAEAKRLSRIADGCIVVGGRTSSNVNKLYEIMRESCGNVQLIESASELDMDAVRGTSLLVIMGGASTPEDSIAQVIERVRADCEARGECFRRVEKV